MSERMTVTSLRRRVCERVTRYQPLITRIATAYLLDARLVAAIVAQESAGEPGAVRVERGFFRRYHAGLVALVRRTVSTRDDHWMQYPDLFSASYGLMQVLYPVALERGMTLQYPTDLCDPATGLEAGCRHLRWCFDHTGGNEQVKAALLRYNGGGNLSYALKVLQWESDVLTSGVWSV